MDIAGLQEALERAGLDATVRARGDETWIEVLGWSDEPDALRERLEAAIEGVAVLSGPVFDHRGLCDVRVLPAISLMMRAAFGGETPASLVTEGAPVARKKAK